MAHSFTSSSQVGPWNKRETEQLLFCVSFCVFHGPPTQQLYSAKDTSANQTEIKSYETHFHTNVNCWALQVNFCDMRVTLPCYHSWWQTSRVWSFSTPRNHSDTLFFGSAWSGATTSSFDPRLLVRHKFKLSQPEPPAVHLTKNYYPLSTGWSPDTRARIKNIITV